MTDISPILCIPSVSHNISESDVKRVFAEANIGHIQYYEEIVLKTNKYLKRILFTLVWNLKHDYINNYKERLEADGSLKIVHSFPWFWIIVVSNRQRIENANKGYVSYNNHRNKCQTLSKNRK
jgi:hypothetical protein